MQGRAEWVWVQSPQGVVGCSLDSGCRTGWAGPPVPGGWGLWVLGTKGGGAHWQASGAQAALLSLPCRLSGSLPSLSPWPSRAP